MLKRSSAFVALFLLLTSVSAQDISFSGDSLELVQARGKERTVLSGNARLVTQDSVITADRMELYNDFTFAVCSGNVRVSHTEKEIELSADKLFYNRRDKILQVQGNAVMLDKKNEIVVKGGFIEDWEEDEITIIQIGVRILREDLVCRAEFARYLRAANKLELSGLPVVRLKDDEYRAAKIYVDLEDDTVRLEGKVQGTVRSDEQER